MHLALPTETLKDVSSTVRDATETVAGTVGELVSEARDRLEALPIPGIQRPKPRRGRRVVFVGLGVALTAGAAWWAWRQTHADDVYTGHAQDGHAQDGDGERLSADHIDRDDDRDDGDPDAEVRSIAV